MFSAATLLALAVLVHLWLRAPSPARAPAHRLRLRPRAFRRRRVLGLRQPARFGAHAGAARGAGDARLFCAFLALFPALAGWIQARIARDSAAPAVLRAVLLVPAALGADRMAARLALHRLSLARARLLGDRRLRSRASRRWAASTPFRLRSPCARRPAVVRRARPRALEGGGRGWLRPARLRRRAARHRVDRAGRRAAARSLRAGQRRRRS